MIFEEQWAVRKRELTDAPSVIGTWQLSEGCAVLCHWQWHVCSLELQKVDILKRACSIVSSDRDLL